MAEILGFIGLGKMGLPMASRLIDAGHELVVYDTQQDPVEALKARGAKGAQSPAAVAAQAETVFLSLPTPDIVETVVLGDQGVVHGDRVRTVIDLSTSGPKVSVALANRLAERGVVFVDCPVSGGVGGARAGTLSVMVSCPRDKFDALQPILGIFGKVFFISEQPGTAQMMKLCNNLMAAASMAIAAEAIATGVKAGIDAAVMVDVINVSSGRNNATLDKFPKTILTRTFNQGFSTGLMFKDVYLCLEEAERMGLQLETAGAVRSVWQKANAKLGPDSDHTRIIEMIEEPAGVTIGTKAS